MCSGVWDLRTRTLFINSLSPSRPKEQRNPVVNRLPLLKTRCQRWYTLFVPNKPYLFITSPEHDFFFARTQPHSLLPCGSIRLLKHTGTVVRMRVCLLSNVELCSIEPEVRDCLENLEPSGETMSRSARIRVKLGNIAWIHQFFFCRKYHWKKVCDWSYRNHVMCSTWNCPEYYARSDCLIC